MTSDLLTIPLKLVKHFLRITHDDEDDLLVLLIQAAEEKLNILGNIIPSIGMDNCNPPFNFEPEFEAKLCNDTKITQTATKLTDLISLVSSLYERKKIHYSQLLSNRQYRL